jgi:hypothetical protein
MARQGKQCDGFFHIRRSNSPSNLSSPSTRRLPATIEVPPSLLAITNEVIEKLLASFAALPSRSDPGTTRNRPDHGLTSAVQIGKRTSEDLAEAKGTAFPSRAAEATEISQCSTRIRTPCDSHPVRQNPFAGNQVGAFGD